MKAYELIRLALTKRVSRNQGNLTITLTGDAPDQTACIRYRGHLIAEYSYSDGRLKLQDCGWPTPTTKRYMNHVLDALHFPQSILQDDWTWYVWSKGRKSRFTDPTYLYADGSVF